MDDNKKIKGKFEATSVSKEDLYRYVVDNFESNENEGKWEGK